MTHRARSAFTLVELLVVMAIIALLVAMLLPALGRAKGVAKLTKEVSNVKQLQQAWANYGTDNKDKYIPGYKHYNWAHTHSSYGGLWLLNREGALMAGTQMKPWPNQIWPYFNWDMRPLVTDSQLWDNFYARPRFQNPGNQYDVSVPTNTYEAAHNWSTSFGYNTNWVGGNFLRGAFFEFRGTPGTPYADSSSMNSPIKRKWYVQTSTAFRNAPSMLMVFTSSRGNDVQSGAAIPAYYDLQSPSGPRATGASVGANWATWAQRGPFIATRAPADYGYVDCRYIDKRAVSGFADGHAEALGIEKYYDMRLWSTWADGPDWQWNAATRTRFVQ